MKTFFTFSAAILISVPVFAVDTPNDLAGATLVNAERAKSLIDSGAKVFDVRVATEFVEEHIPGAMNIPYKENSKKEVGFDASQDKFPIEGVGADKNASVLFQCNGPECWKSYKAASLAVKAGFKKVYWFRGGIPEWKQKGLPVEK
jgi:rhodanese-related sulfurtransferase